MPPIPPENRADSLVPQVLPAVRAAEAALAGGAPVRAIEQLLQAVGVLSDALVRVRELHATGMTVDGRARCGGCGFPSDHPVDEPCPTMIMADVDRSSPSATGQKKSRKPMLDEARQILIDNGQHHQTDALLQLAPAEMRADWPEPVAHR